MLPEYKIINDPGKKSDTLVIVPVYNEMPHLGEVFESIRKHWDGDILAVDDHSADNSLDELQANSSLRVIHNLQNAGAGGVLLQGFRYAQEEGYESVITMDADGQHTPMCIADFMKEIKPDWCCGECKSACREIDFIWGSRYLAGIGDVQENFKKRQQVNIEITNRLNNETTYNLTDSFCGFRAYRLEALAKLNLTETGYGMFMQMTIQAARAGLRIKEIPVPLVYLDETRNFQNQFTDTETRLKYYHSVIDATLAT